MFGDPFLALCIFFQNEKKKRRIVVHISMLSNAMLFSILHALVDVPYHMHSEHFCVHLMLATA